MPRYSTEEKKAVVEDYLSGLSSHKIAEKYGMTPSTVCRTLHNEDIEIRDPNERKRTYKIDDTFFARINTHEKAQILGFIYADGCIAMKSPTSGNLQIILAEADSAYLEWVKATMKSDRENYHTVYLNNDGRTRKAAWFVTSHPDIIRDLAHLGVGPRKSLTIGFPTTEQVPDEFMGSFIRGVFEGDGCIYLGRCRRGPTIKAEVSICGSLPFNTGLQRWLVHHSIECSVDEHPTKQNLPITVLRIQKVASIMRFYDLIYADGTYRMERKHQKFLTYKAAYREMTTMCDGVETREWELLQRKEFTLENMARVKCLAFTNGMSTATPAYFKSPDGKIYHTDAVKPFCREFNLRSKSMYGIMKGKVPRSKGWTAPTELEIETARANGTIIERVHTYPTTASAA